MGYVISSSENVNRVSVEIRRESIIISNPEGTADEVYVYKGMTDPLGREEFEYDSCEISKSYFKELMIFFKNNPQYLEDKDFNRTPSHD